MEKSNIGLGRCQPVRVRLARLRNLWGSRLKGTSALFPFLVWKCGVGLHLCNHRPVSPLRIAGGRVWPTQELEYAPLIRVYSYSALRVHFLRGLIRSAGGHTACSLSFFVMLPRTHERLLLCRFAKCQEFGFASVFRDPFSSFFFFGLFFGLQKKMLSAFSLAIFSFRGGV